MLCRAGFSTGNDNHPLPRASRPGLRPFRCPGSDLICRIPPPFQPGNGRPLVERRPIVFGNSLSLGETTAPSIRARPERGPPRETPRSACAPARRIAACAGMKAARKRFSSQQDVLRVRSTWSTSHISRAGGGNKRTTLEGAATAYSGAPLPHAGAEPARCGSRS